MSRVVDRGYAGSRHRRAVLGIEKYGKAASADSVNNKYPIDTPGRMKAAWAYIPPMTD